MKITDLVDLMNNLHEIFPLPEDGKFKGTHDITLNKKGQLQVGIWYSCAGKIFCAEYGFHDYETLTRDDMIVMRDQLSECLKGEETPPVVDSSLPTLEHERNPEGE